MSKTVSAGIVTAYGAAVRGGYQGTYDQFCADLVQLTDVLNDLTGLNVTIETLAEGSQATAHYADGVLSLGIPRGATGNGIQSVALISTAGLVKTYRITYTDSEHFDFNVQDGKGIQSIVQNADYTLTVTYTDGTSWTSGSIRGAKGETGATPNLTIGTVTTLPAGQDATAEIGGTAEEPVLNFGIPKGADGEVSAASMAQNYDPDATYEVGDYCWQAGQLYRCTVAIDTPEAWTPEHWAAVQLADEVDDLKSALTIYGKQMDEMIPFILTDTNYFDVMKAFFLGNGCNAMVDYTALCDRWYKSSRKGWTGGVLFANPTQSSVSTGTRTGDNVGMACVPSTFTQKNEDDYEQNPLFAIRDCNVYLDENGEPKITAIDGICGGFIRNDPEHIVGVLQATGWWERTDNDDGSYEYSYSDEIGKDGYHPLPEAVRLADNTVRSWVVHGKYSFGDGYSCCSGQKVRVWNVSHNSQLTGVRNKWGNRYCGMTSADDAFLKLMLYIKYARLDSDSVLHGCCDYNYIYQLALAETGVERILITTAQANNLEVGSVICVGTNTDRGSESTNTNLLDRVVITAIETVEINGTSYGAVYVDNGGETFDTATTYYMYTFQWHTGHTDKCLGNDGGQDPLSIRFPVRLQGIEYMVGCYDVKGDTILQYEQLDGVAVQRAHVCRDASKLSTSITAGYKGAAFGYPIPASSSWTWPAKMGYDASLPEIITPVQSGGSSSTLIRDGYYVEHATGGLREWPSFGSLGGGLENAGLSCMLGNGGLGSASWTFGGRLSLTGNRGEWAA